MEGALETAREAEQLARRAGVGEAIVKAVVWRARLRLTMGELAAAAYEQTQSTPEALATDRRA